MGGLVIETIRAGVQFTPDAAAAFRRAEAQVIAEFGRPIDVNSTYRSWADQMKMFTDWNAWIAGIGPRPSHSKAVHPSDSFHVSGLALDSDDWTNARIVQILAENGFIRNRLYVLGEDHHFEYDRSQDQNYGKEIDMPLNDADKKWIKAEIARGARLVWTGKSVANGARWGDMLRAIYDSVRFGKKGVRTHGDLAGMIAAETGAQKAFRLANGGHEAIDVDELAEAVAANLNQVDAERLASAILKAQGKALSSLT